MANQTELQLPMATTDSENYRTVLSEYEKHISAGQKAILYYCYKTLRYSCSIFASKAGLESFGLVVIK